MTVDTYRYILDENGDPAPCPDLMTWADWFERNYPIRVARTVLPNGIEVSSIFLGFNMSGAAPPVLFETMVFLGREPLDQFRYPTWEELAAHHLELVAEYTKRGPAE